MCTFSNLVFSGTKPSRLDTLSTCVSTGNAGRFKANKSTHAAVLGPTPGKLRSQLRASSKGFVLSSARSQVPFV